MSLKLKDPRQYSSCLPDSNLLINQARYDLEHNDSMLRPFLEDVLARGDDQLLSVAYNLAPSAEIARYLWDTMQLVLNQPDTKRYAKLFAIPITIVVGSSVAVELPNQIDELALHNLLKQKKLYQKCRELAISGKLFDLAAVSKAKPSQLYQQVFNPLSLEDWEMDLLDAPPIINQGEQVHLRFLLGAALYDDGAENQLRNVIGNNIGNVLGSEIEEAPTLGMELLSLLTKNLATEGATIFPLPFALCALSESNQLGEFYRQEIALSVFLSGTVKRMRLEGKQAHVRVMVKPEQIQIELKSHAAVEGVFCWNLHRADNFTQVCEVLHGLFTDLQLTVSYAPADQAYSSDQEASSDRT